MSSADAALWRQRLLRFALGGGAPLVSGVFSVLRNKWLAQHLEAAGLGVITQVVAGQIWLGTMTGLGLTIPVAQAIGRALPAGDTLAARRAVWTAFAMVAPAAMIVVIAGFLFARPLSIALLGTPEHEMLVRLSMIGVAGLAFQGCVQGVYAGRSDVRAPLVLALVGGATALAVTLALVPRYGLAGGVFGAAVLYPAGVLASWWGHRRRYGAGATARASFDAATARRFLEVAAAAFVLSLIDQGTLLALRSHYVRQNGVADNGLLQSALALAQQGGGLFYAYLAGYAFGRVSGITEVERAREYTARVWTPVMLTATAFFGLAMAFATPLLSLFYSSRFVAARPMIAWTLLGEFARVGVQVWALASLPIGGIRLWAPVGLASAAAQAIAYAALTRAGFSAMSLPLAYAVGGFVSLAFTAAWMSRRGLHPDGRGIVVLLASSAGLAWLARWVAAGATPAP